MASAPAPVDALRELKTLTFEQVRALLPHRYPLLMIDRVTLVERGVRIVGIKNVSGNDIWFLGHFPEHAVMPGVLIAEAVAQAITVLIVLGKPGEPVQELPQISYLTNINMTFKRPVVPGDQMIISVEVVKWISHGIVCNSKVHVDGVLAASATLTLGRPMLNSMPEAS
jgi:3-hydroxyacyl-[acyl-carrier-protein] dehydratase